MNRFKQFWFKTETASQLYMEYAEVANISQNSILDSSQYRANVMNITVSVAAPKTVTTEWEA